MGRGGVTTALRQMTRTPIGPWRTMHSNERRKSSPDSSSGRPLSGMGFYTAKEALSETALRNTHEGRCTHLVEVVDQPLRHVLHHQ